MPASDDTLLRHLKKGATRGAGDVRVLGIDDWSWRKGESYETVMVDARFSTSCPDARRMKRRLG